MIDVDRYATGAPGITTLPQLNLPSIEAVHLGTGEAHIWRADLESLPLPENWQDILSRDEAERARRFRFERDKRHFITCRALLRLLLGNYLELAPAEVVFRYSSHHKPSLAYPSSDIRFNLSHSGERAVFAFIRGRELGVDIEHIRHGFETQSVAQRFFSLAEREALARIPPEISHEAFFHCWTRKEAFVKAKGDGLFLPLDQFDVSLVPGQPAQLLETRPDLEERHRWSLCALEVGAQYTGALVVQGTAIRVVNYWIPQSSAPSASTEIYRRPR
jgi:4'-phosphopantetheinyl transferase